METPALSLFISSTLRMPRALLWAPLACKLQNHRKQPGHPLSQHLRDCMEVRKATQVRPGHAGGEDRQIWPSFRPSAECFQSGRRVSILPVELEAPPTMPEPMPDPQED